MRHKNPLILGKPNGRLCAAVKRLPRTPRNIGEIVDRYILEYRDKHEREMNFYRRDHLSLRNAVNFAARCVGISGKHPHQWRLTEKTLNNAASALEPELKAIRKCGDFESLMSLLEDKLGNVWGIGELTTYDIAHRIGAHLGFDPELIYLHRGTRDGAKVLGIDGKLRAIKPSVLPSAFRRLRPCEIEDALCIYKDELKQLSSRGSG
jgi:hypothetical protein